MSQEISHTGEPDVTDDLPVNRNGHEHHGIKLTTPLGEIAIAVRTPRGGLAVPKRLDPFGVANRALGAAKLGIKLAAWGGEQLAILGKSQIETIDVAPRQLVIPAPEKPAEQSLNSKLGKLLDRALDQSTTDSRAELYHRLLDQLVADEARIISALSDGATSTLVNVYRRNRSGTSGQPVLENACLVGRTANVALPAMVPQYINHLLALGLVETGPEDPALKEDYEVLTAETMVLRAVKRASRGPLPARVELRTLCLSELGRGLWTAAMETSDD
ncbi:Abi-alpha family protein [Mycobacterium sp. OTB74]|uniref:Abi-alpha family protein n=1 Tax=Mycobacterium sp. OTB74 TaxID=1853452 RepID=UPI00247569D3|nr:Abi-alpha family protein [Mycobacterium sp. OTB74]MDH6243718.1 hypothetical protein [Mycobacterium sp. OTB74]